MMMLKILPLGLVCAAVVGSVQADKDDSYYKPGSGNPNIYQKMYWSDAEAVLQDISKFQTLYVQFQHCAWTWMDYGEDDEGSVDENDYWYMGKVPPFGANVAFSLYGSLTDDKSFSGCNADTFINSFYTKNGFSEFIYSMAYAGVQAFSSYDFSGYSSECQGYAGVGCDSSNGFAVHQYSTEECNPAYYKGVSDNMQNFNQAMQSAQCVQIFDKSSGSNWNGYNYTIYGTPLELLAYSQACFYQNFWSPDGECPDPYNKLQYYQTNFNRGIKKSKKSDPFEQYTNQMAEAKQLSILGTMLLVSAGLVLVIGMFLPSVKRSMSGGRRKEQIISDSTPPPPTFTAPQISVTPTASAAPPILQPQTGDDDTEILQARSGESMSSSPQGVSPKKKGRFRLFGKK